MESSSNKLSLREKALFKRRINREHNSNLRAGYVHVTEEQLNKTGLRGKKLIAVYILTFLLILVALSNIIVTILIVKTLDLNVGGMASMEFVSQGKLLNFKEETEIMKDVVLVENSVFDDGAGIDLCGANRNALTLDASGPKGPKLSITNEEVVISDVERFLAVDPATDKTIFSTDYENFQFPEHIHSLKSFKILTNQVNSPTGENLHVSTGDTGNINLTADKGIKILGKSLSMSARRNLNIEGKKSLLLQSKSGIFLNNVLNLAKVPSLLINIPERLDVTYKLCVCKMSGRIFQVDSQYRCDEGTDTPDHPCA